MRTFQKYSEELLMKIVKDKAIAICGKEAELGFIIWIEVVQEIAG